MLLPIRCFTCNKILGNYNNAWQNSCHDPHSFFEKYNIKRYCCQKIFMTHIDIYEHDPQINLPHVHVSYGGDVKKILKAD